MIYGRSVALGRHQRNNPVSQCVETAIGEDHFDGLVQDCSNSSALAMELLQSCTDPSIYTMMMSSNNPVSQFVETAIGEDHFDGLVQYCSNSSALAMELLQSCTDPSIYIMMMSSGAPFY